MNSKLAKRLRKQANYKPGGKPTVYEIANKSRKAHSTGTVEIHAAEPRYIYRELKKEAKASR